MAEKAAFELENFYTMGAQSGALRVIKVGSEPNCLVHVTMSEVEGEDWPALIGRPLICKKSPAQFGHFSATEISISAPMMAAEALRCRRTFVPGERRQGVDMSHPFNASLIDGGPVSAEVLAEQDRKIADLMQRPNALANARLHAEQHMARLVRHCNRTAWGTITSETRGPTQEETAALLDQLAPENRDKLLAEVRAAAGQRALLAKMEGAQQHALSQLEAAQAEAAQHDAAVREWAEFQAHDAATQEERFRAWRAARSIVP